MSQEFAALDATAQAELVQRREVSPRDLVEAAITRLERLNPALNAVSHPCLERARKRAARLEPGSGPFAGVPLVMKDIGGSEAGEPYHAGMRFLRDQAFVESEDSYVAQRLQAAGFVSLGRTNTPELGLLPTTECDAHGPTRNPYNLDHSAGGSSGGSAAAVASGIVAVAHASDGGGSIRIPASSCGLVGLKPTRGRVSFGPSHGERWSGLSTEFALTRSVRDCAALLDVLAGPMPGDPYTAPPPRTPFRDALGAQPSGLRIGVLRRAPRNEPLDPECRTAVDRMARTLEDLGHKLEEACPPALDEGEAGVHWLVIAACNTALTLARCGERAGRDVTQSDVEPLTWALAERGRLFPAYEWLRSLEFIHAYGRRLRSFWDRAGFDLLLTPTTAAPPPPLGHVRSTDDDPLRALTRAAPFGIYTLPFNLSGQPAISLPIHHTPGGLPVGAHLCADFGREDLLLGVAAQVEEARPWTHPLPGASGRLN